MSAGPPQTDPRLTNPPPPPGVKLGSPTCQSQTAQFVGPRPDSLDPDVPSLATGYCTAAMTSLEAAIGLLEWELRVVVLSWVERRRELRGLQGPVELDESPSRWEDQESTGCDPWR